MSVALKIGYKGEIHRVRVDLAVFGLAELESLFEATFALPRGSFAIEYKAMDGSFVNVACGREFHDACEQLLRVSPGIVRFFAVSKTQAKLNENLQHAFATFSQTMEKMPWIKAQEEKLSRAGDAFNHAMTKTIEESKVALEMAKKNLCDIEMDKIFDESKRFVTDFFKKKENQHKWNYQLTTIHNIFPDIPTEDLIPALEKANGDIHVVLNQIMMA